MANKINKGKVDDKGMVKIHLSLPQSLKKTLIDLHQKYMDENGIRVGFIAFVVHLLEKAVKDA